MVLLTVIYWLDAKYPAARIGLGSNDPTISFFAFLYQDHIR